MKRRAHKRAPVPVFCVIGIGGRRVRGVTFFESTDAEGKLRIESSPPVQLQQVAG